MGNLSDHFLDRELNVESAGYQVKRMAEWGCVNILEPVRAQFGPLAITSGYRSPQHNTMIGGVSNSFHLYPDGKGAADFHVPGHDIVDVFKWIRESALPFDKVILEYDSTRAEIIHVQWAVPPFRNRTAWTGETHGRSGYTKVDCAPGPGEEPLSEQQA